jgi:hypothetical protein
MIQDTRYLLAFSPSRLLAFSPSRLLASCYAHLGRLDNAREIVRRLRAITAVVISDGGMPRNPEHRELALSGLRLAAAADAN